MTTHPASPVRPSSSRARDWLGLLPLALLVPILTLPASVLLAVLTVVLLVWLGVVAARWAAGDSLAVRRAPRVPPETP